MIAGRVPACKRVRQAAERHLRDMKRAGTDGFPFVFDALRAEHMCAFIEGLPHIKGSWAARGERLVLLPWQAFLVASIGGWVHRETGNRRFRTAYVEVPRKNGKSTLLAGIGLYFMTVDGEPGAEVYTAASSTDQARIVFDMARTMVENAEHDGQPLAPRLGLIVERHKIRSVRDEAAVLRAIAAQTKSKDGKNPHCAIVDELHEHEKRDVWDSMDSALGAREQPLLIAITTAGWNLAGVCFEQRRYLGLVLDLVLENEAYFGIIFEADEGDDPGDEAVWAKANPSLGASKSIDYMRDQWTKAQASPASRGEFLRKHLDIWTSVGAAALDLDAWNAAVRRELRIADFRGRRAWIGVDLATRDDFASVVAVIPDGADWIAFAWHFLPEKQVHLPGNEHLWGWKSEGRIVTTPGADLDLRVVEALVLALAGAAAGEWGWEDFGLDVAQVVYDPQYAAQMVHAWEDAGITCVELRSGARNWNEPFNRLISAVEDGRFVTDGDPVLRWMAANTMLKRVNGGDYIYPAKLSPADKIDGIAATLNAIWPLYQVEEAAELDVMSMIA
ncbi:MAG TPA: terminase large subunit [Amaricoccus sp.]|uniref:terminase large subunit n=1 Tax=Amaricoccus sp. TaxID=1872485 RepID=UPI002CAE2256|nr:terminase TerL endonuclease subunit [Amaricoccus sp.]HMR51205.1 terminase large subunit [Amaricoccus sp.]HMT98046.1 terminase large subunit [Amaricoccus sp.]